MEIKKTMSFLIMTAILALGVACSSTKKQEEPVAETAVSEPVAQPEAPAADLGLGASSSGLGH